MRKPVYGVLLVSFSRHSHQRSFVPLFVRHPRTRIVAVTDEPDIDPDLMKMNRKWADELNVPYIDGVDAAYDRDDVDIVSIGHEIERRADLIKRAVSRGKRVWIDKFIGSTMEECDAVVEAVKVAGVATIVPSYTYGELAARSLEIIGTGALGELLGVHADVMFSKGTPRPVPAAGDKIPFLPPGQWKFPDIKRELLTVGAYAVGLVQTLLSGICCVYGQAGAHFFPEHAVRGAEDFGLLTMTDQLGRIATISGGRIGAGTHPFGGPSGAYLVGARGTARIDGKRPLVETYLRKRTIHANYTPAPDDPMQWASTSPTQGISAGRDSLARGLDDLIEALDHNRLPRYTVRDARDHMEILLAGYQSILNDAPLALPIARKGGA